MPPRCTGQLPPPHCRSHTIQPHRTPHQYQYYCTNTSVVATTSTCQSLRLREGCAYQIQHFRHKNSAHATTCKYVLYSRGVFYVIARAATRRRCVYYMIAAAGRVGSERGKFGAAPHTLQPRFCPIPVTSTHKHVSTTTVSNVARQVCRRGIEM